MHYGKSLTGMAALAGVMLVAGPAHAQAVCEINGTNAGGTSTAATFGSVGCGANALATTNYAIAIGGGVNAPTTASGTQAVAIGGAAGALGFDSISIGFQATTTSGGNNVAIGGQTNAGTNDTVVGFGSNASGSNSVAIGYSAGTSTVSNALAIGANAQVTGAGSVAIGYNSSTGTFTNSVALGTGTAATANNQVNVGGRTIGNVANGVATNDAVNVGQLNTATAGLGTSISTLNSNVAALGAGLAAAQGDIDNLYANQRRDRQDMRQGVAAAVAIANAPLPSAPGKVSYAVNGALFRGEYAVGGSLNYRLNTDAPIAFGVGVSHGGGKNTAVRVGVAGEF